MKVKREAFTLIELLVIIVIIIILLSFGFSFYEGYKERARDAKRDLELAQIERCSDIIDACAADGASVDSCYKLCDTRHFGTEVAGESACPEPCNAGDPAGTCCNAGIKINNTSTVVFDEEAQDGAYYAHHCVDIGDYVTCLYTWQEGIDHCTSLGKRLPTPDEMTDYVNNVVSPAGKSNQCGVPVGWRWTSEEVSASNATLIHKCYNETDKNKAESFPLLCAKD